MFRESSLCGNSVRIASRDISHETLSLIQQGGLCSLARPIAVMESTGEPVTGNRKRREVSMLSNDSGYSTGSALSQPEGCRRASGTYTTKVAYAAPEIPLSAPSEVDDARTLSAYSNDSGYYSTSSGQLKMPPRYNSDDVAIDQQFAPKFYRSTTRGSRPFTAHEDLTARTFETHASVCFECRTINGARNAHHHFCNAGKRHAERVESLFYMTERGDVMSWNSAVRVEVPSDLIEFGKLLKSIGDSAFVVARASRTKAKFPSASIRRAVTFSEDSGPRETPSRILRLSDASEDDEDPPARGSLYESDVKALRRFEKQRSTVVIRSGGKEQDDPTTRKTTDARRRQEQSDRLLAEKLAREEESRQARIELSPHEIKESMLADDRTAERLLGEASTLKSTWIEKQQGSRREFQMRQLTATQEESRQGRSELLDSSETARLRAETTALERGKAEEIQATHTMNRLRRLSISSDSSSGFRSHSSLLGGKLKPVKFSCLVPAQRRSRSPHSHVSEHSSRQVSSLLDQPQRPKQLPKSGYICQELEELGVRGFVSSPELPSHAQGTERSDANGDAESDTSEMHTLPRSVNRLLETAIFGVKQLLLQELVDYALPEAMDGVESSSSSEVLPTSRSIVQSGNRKRVRGDGRDPGEEPDSDDPTDDDNDRPKKRNGKGPSGGPSRRLKCPFYQRQPEKYTKAACRGEGFADMAKLKWVFPRYWTTTVKSASVA
ncbi:hypothetical protein BDV96DRAFT_40518 [Lophiotrema nucula]|uniref:Uncharacterized protein n=1 Tax=Lophiotrema nucula TaxID=690887 RepID=A0A6A5Z9A5_9PLEO|nr:hypothetical protein BDV96DRAFT_40518 [Lophiotrema nucula]